jgi:hypothetical protein
LLSNDVSVHPTPRQPSEFDVMMAAVRLRQRLARPRGDPVAEITLTPFKRRAGAPPRGNHGACRHPLASLQSPFMGGAAVPRSARFRVRCAHFRRRAGSGNAATNAATRAPEEGGPPPTQLMQLYSSIGLADCDKADCDKGVARLHWRRATRAKGRTKGKGCSAQPRRSAERVAWRVAARPC